MRLEKTLLYSQIYAFLRGQNSKVVFNLQQPLPRQLDLPQRLTLLVSSLTCAHRNSLSKLDFVFVFWECARAMVRESDAGQRARA